MNNKRILAKDCIVSIDTVETKADSNDVAQNNLATPDQTPDLCFTRICTCYFDEAGIDERYHAAIRNMTKAALIAEGWLTTIDNRTYPTETGKASGMYEKSATTNGRTFIGVYYNESARRHVEELLAAYTETATKVNMLSKSYRRMHKLLYVKGTFNGEVISFNREWGNHTFTDDEVTKLLNGEVIEISYRDRNGKTQSTTGRIAKNMGKEYEYWGFTPDFDRNSGGHDGQTKYIRGSFDGKEISFKRVWGGHMFTDEEVSKLLNGEVIEVSYQDKYGHARKANGQLKEREGTFRKYWGFEPSFAS